MEQNSYFILEKKIALVENTDVIIVSCIDAIKDLSLSIKEINNV